MRKAKRGLFRGSLQSETIRSRSQFHRHFPSEETLLLHRKPDFSVIFKGLSGQGCSLGAPVSGIASRQSEATRLALFCRENHLRLHLGPARPGKKPWFFPRRRHGRRGRREKRKKRIRTSGSAVVINFVKPLMDIFAHALKEG